MPHSSYLHEGRITHLRHEGDPFFNGFTAEGALLIDEIYGEDDWLARYCLPVDGSLVVLEDEDPAAPIRSTIPARPVTIPLPPPPRLPNGIEFGGGRLRGLRAEDRIQELVQPVTMADKMALAAEWKLNVPPPFILGLAERRVRQATVLPGGGWLLCLHLRFAVGLAQSRHDTDGSLYDYDSRWLYGVLMSEAEDIEPDIGALLTNPLRQYVRAPVDCCCHGQRLYVAERGAPGIRSAIHRWQIGPSA